LQATTIWQPRGGRRAAAANPDRVVLLCEGGRILAHSDRPDNMQT
jgi:hypothetical protein